MSSIDNLLHRLKNFSQLGSFVDCMRAIKGKTPEDEWADWCFLPYEIWLAMAAQFSSVPKEQAIIASFLNTFGTWRYSQGIYRFDQDFYTAIADSDFSGNLPSEVLLRLPEWCVYIETPKLRYVDAEIDGFFAYLDDDRRNHQIKLHLTLIEHDSSSPTELLTFPIQLGNWSVEEAYKRFVHSTLQYMKSAQVSAAQIYKIDSAFSATELESIAIIKKMISLLLYLCTDAPDLSNRTEPEQLPRFPQPKEVKGGVRYFPAEKTRIYDVGLSLGQKLRQALERMPSAPTGQHVRSHLRRGHWQGYWHGPRNSSVPDARKCIPHWIHPLFVRGGADQNEYASVTLSDSEQQPTEKSVGN